MVRDSFDAVTRTDKILVNRETGWQDASLSRTNLWDASRSAFKN